MKFYDRENEMHMLHEIESATHEGSRMTVLVGPAASAKRSC